MNLYDITGVFIFKLKKQNETNCFKSNRTQVNNNIYQ